MVRFEIKDWFPLKEHMLKHCSKEKARSHIGHNVSEHSNNGGIRTNRLGEPSLDCVHGLRVPLLDGVHVILESK